MAAGKEMMLRRRRRRTIAALCYPSVIFFVFTIYVLMRGKGQHETSSRLTDLSGSQFRHLLSETQQEPGNDEQPETKHQTGGKEIPTENHESPQNSKDVPSSESEKKADVEDEDKPGEKTPTEKNEKPVEESGKKSKTENEQKPGNLNKNRTKTTESPKLSVETSSTSIPTSPTETTTQNATSTESSESPAESSMASTDLTKTRQRMVHKSLWDEENITCLPPAYHEFPPDLFSKQQRQKGAVIIHLLVGIYMFYALAVVCDSYFVNSLETICEKIGLSEDVAGATFMAAGSSAPELFASILGVFVAKGDVGTGTIVGSAVFNVLFVIGACSILAGQSVPLTWWPLLRDSSFYAFTVIVLILVMADGSVTWWEAAIMLSLYIVYIILMKFNVKIREWLTDNTILRQMDEITQSSRGILDTNLTGKVHSSYVQFNNDMNPDYSDVPNRDMPPPLDVCLRDHRRRMTLVEAFLRMLMTNHFRPLTRFRSAAKRLILEYRRQQRDGPPVLKEIDLEMAEDYPKKEIPSGDSSGDTDEWKRVPTSDDGILQMISWAVTLPVQATLYFTIPNCRKPKYEKWFLATFTNSMFWIALFSYCLVWMVTLVGNTFGIPDSIMGITFLAAGTSVPDALSSLLVAKQGQGDMAVSNSIGSNVFDILVGLALPWFIQTSSIMPGSKVYINSRGMVYNVLLLFLSVGVTIAAIHKNNWQLNSRLGLILMVTYGIFLIFSILIEYNVFGFVNPPECDE